MTSAELKKKIALAIKDKKRLTVGCGCSVVATIYATGVCKFSVRIKKDGTDAKIKLGNYPDMTLAEAWAKAEQIKKSGDTEQESQIKFSSYIDAFLDEKRRNGKNEKRANNLKSYLKHVSFLNDVAFSDIDSLEVEDKLRNSTLSQANLSLVVGALNQYLDWCVKRRYANFNPCLPLKDLKEFKRHPTTGFACVAPDKLKEAFFESLEEHPDPFLKCFYLTLALTGIRFDGVRHMRWDWIKDGKIYVPAKHTKTSKDYVCPVSDALSNVLKKLKALQNSLGITSQYLFTSTGARIACEDVFRRPLRLYVPKDEAGNVVHSLHGFRKVFKTWCQSRGIKTKRLMEFRELSERQLGHASDNRLEDVYGHYDYMEERLSLMNEYAEFIKTQLTPQFLALCEP